MSALWYATRATGEVALVFLTAVVTLGILSAIRVGGRRVPRFVVAGLHRNLTLAGIGFLLVHIATAIADSYAPIGLADAVVPFGSAYRPVWLGLGTVAFDALLVLTATSLLRTRLGYRRWKALHWAAYGCWVAAFVHALGTGSDARSPLVLAAAGACGAAVLATVAWRLSAGGREHRAARAGGALLALLTVTAVGAWTVTGPLAAGWARRAGTPDRLLVGPAAPTGQAPGSTAGSGTAPAPPSTRGERHGGDDDDEDEHGGRHEDEGDDE